MAQFPQEFLRPLTEATGVSHKQLAEKLGELGVHKNGRNIANKLARGRVFGAFLGPMFRGNRLQYGQASFHVAVVRNENLAFYAETPLKLDAPDVSCLGAETVLR
jgi:hypothetical protein